MLDDTYANMDLIGSENRFCASGQDTACETPNDHPGSVTHVLIGGLLDLQSVAWFTLVFSAARKMRASCKAFNCFVSRDRATLGFISATCRFTA